MAKLSRVVDALETSVTSPISEFTIDVNENLFRMLTDSLYADKHEAIIRELFSNALDAHASVNKRDVPFRVCFPTDLSGELIIRDFGPGISKRDIYDVYIHYARSTKTNTNAQVGCYGLGSKTPLCLVSSFTVKSYHAGVASTYCVFLNERRVPAILHVSDQPCGDETGLEIAFTVSKDDVSTFASAIRRVCRFYAVRPVILNQEISYDEPRVRFQLGPARFVENLGQPLSVLYGQLCYPVSGSAFSSALRAFGMMAELTTSERQFIGLIDAFHGLLLETEIGELELSVSRESLQYTATTCRAILSKLLSVHRLLVERVGSIASCKTQLDFQLQLIQLASSVFKNDRRGAGDFLLNLTTSLHPWVKERISRWDDIYQLFIDDKVARGEGHALQRFDSAKNRFTKCHSTDRGFILPLDSQTVQRGVELFVHDLSSVNESKARIRARQAKLGEGGPIVYLLSFEPPPGIASARKTSELAPMIKERAAASSHRAFNVLEFGLLRVRPFRVSSVDELSRFPVYHVNHAEIGTLRSFICDKAQNLRDLRNFLGHVIKRANGKKGERFFVILLGKRQAAPDGSVSLFDHLRKESAALLQNADFARRLNFIDGDFQNLFPPSGPEYTKRFLITDWVNQWENLKKSDGVDMSRDFEQLVEFLATTRQRAQKHQLTYVERMDVECARRIMAWLGIRDARENEAREFVSRSFSNVLSRYPMLKFIQSSTPLSEVLSYVNLVSSSSQSMNQ